MDFKVKNFDVLKKDGGGTTFTLTGVMNCDYLYLQDNVALKDMTSYQAMMQIAILPQNNLCMPTRGRFHVNITEGFK